MQDFETRNYTRWGVAGGRTAGFMGRASGGAHPAYDHVATSSFHIPFLTVSPFGDASIDGSIIDLKCAVAVAPYAKHLID